MIKSNELRLGNLIASGKEYTNISLIGKVLSIGNEEQEYEQIYCECNESFEWFFKDNYCGIPLSAEILEKAGFVCHDYKTRKKYSTGYFQISLYPNGDVIFIWSGKVIYIKSVHQLQNLIFALTGEELPV